MNGIIIQARMRSSRLPSKALKNLHNKPLLWHVYNRCSASQLANTVIVATTIDKSDDEIEKFCKLNKIPFYRGSINNVLERYYKAAKKFKLSVIARVTADCPLIDPDTIDRCYREFKKQKCDYISNVVPGERTFPRGLDVEIFSFSALEKAYENAAENLEKEHVTPYLWQNKKKEFAIGNIVTASPELKRNYRLTIDYPEDFALIDIIYEKLSTDKIIPIDKAISFLDDHSEIASINANCEQKHNLHAQVNIIQKKTKRI